MNHVSDIHNFWRWWSVQLGCLSGACGAAITVYAGFNAFDPKIVAGIPQVVLTVLAGTGTAGAFLGVYARRWAQALPPAPPSAAADKAAS